MSDYRSSYGMKSRDEMDNRKKTSYPRDGSGVDKHRDYSSKHARRGDDERRDYGSDRRDSSMKRPRDNYPPGGSKEPYNKEKMDSFSSRNRDSYSGRGGRDSFSMRGGRGSMSSRGAYGSNRGNRGSFGGPRGGGRDSFSSRGSFRDRDSYSNRGSFGYPRGNNRDSFSSRGSYGSPRGGRDSYSSRGRDSYQGRGMRGSGRGFRGSKRGSKSDNFMPPFGHRSHLEMAKKLSASLLDDADVHGHYDDRPYRMKDFKREGRDYPDRDSDRSYKESSRSYDHHQSFTHGEKLIKRERSSSSAHYDKEKEYYSEKSKMRLRNKYEGTSSKRMHDDENLIDHHDGPPRKHQRLEKRDRYRESSSHEDLEESYGRRTRSSYSPACLPSSNRDERPRRLSKERDRGDSSASGKSRDRSRKREEREIKRESEEIKRRRRKIKEEIKEENGDEGEEMEDRDDKDKVIKVKREFPSPREDEEMEDEGREEDCVEDYEEDRRRETSPSGMQVTIRSDGERAVNSEGRVKSRISGISGKIFVELQCPHCPGQRSITFKEYRYHLDSRSHRNKIEKLTYKHSIGLRRIRLQQRNEQRDIEEKWEKDNPEEFKKTISTYCNLCKLAYKCLPDDNSSKGVQEHNESKLHKVQQRYLYPRCVMCRMSFPSRLVYEYHIASIRHLRMSTMCRENGQEGSNEEDFNDEGTTGDKEEIDLTNFITMDSVGEDEEIGSEQEEITGKLEDIEKAEEDAKEGEGEEEEEGAEPNLDEDEEHFEIGVDEELELEEEPLRTEERNPCGKEFIMPMSAVYCKLCHKAIRLDTPLGESIVDRHCSSEQHIENFGYMESEEFLREQDEDGRPIDEEALPEEEEEEEGEENVNPDDTLEEAGENDEEREDPDREVEEVMEEQGDDIDLDNHDEDIISIKDSKANEN